MGVIVEWYSDTTERKKTPAKMTMVLAFSMLAAFTNQRQFLRLLPLIIKASEAMDLANFDTLSTY